MTRHSLAATAPSPLSSIGAVVRLTLKSLTAPAVSNPDLEALEAEQARIRASSRLWLLG